MNPYQHLRWTLCDNTVLCSFQLYTIVKNSSIFDVGRGSESASSKVRFFKHLKFHLQPNKKLLFAKYHNKGELRNTANTYYRACSEYLTSKAFEKFAFFHSAFFAVYSFLPYSFIPYLITNRAIEFFTIFIIRQSTKKDGPKTRRSLSD